MATNRTVDRRRLPCVGRSTRRGAQPPAPRRGARREALARVRRRARQSVADDRKRLRIFLAMRDRGAGKRPSRQARLLDPGDVRRGTVDVMRKTAAGWAGNATGLLSRITRRGGGTTLPGDIARALDPQVLPKLSRDLTNGSIVITGTNGKTTTARLISWLLEGAGNRVVANRAGANLIFGVTAAAVNQAGTNGKLRADWGVFEIDEASLPKAVAEIQPKATLVLNLFRDQLDRYGELETIAKKIEKALSVMPDAATAILNADDPRVAEIR